MTTRRGMTGFGARITALVVGVVLLSRPARAESVDRAGLIDEALRLCWQIPDDDCQDMGPPRPGRPLLPEVHARRLRAGARVDLTIQLIRQRWLAGDHDLARTEAKRLISWSVGQTCPTDPDGGRMYERLIEALRSPGTTEFGLELVRQRARTNPDYASSRAGAATTFTDLMAMGSIDDALASLGSLPDSTRFGAMYDAAFGLAGRAPLDSVAALYQRLPSGVANDYAYNNLAVHAAFDDQPDIAAAAVDSMGDEHRGKENILALVAMSFARAGRFPEATAYVARVFDLDARQGSEDRRGLDVNGFGYAGAALLLAGADDELARRRPAIPDEAWRRILMDRASRSAEAGHLDDALVDIETAQALPVWIALDDNIIDEGVVEWIGAQADSGNELAAVRALERLHSRTLRGSAWSRIARARSRRGDVSGASAAADSITQCTWGLADALASVSIARAVAGDIEASLTTLDGATARLSAMCPLPIDGPLGLCPHAPECPPVTIIFNMRRQALRGIGTTLRTRAELNRVLTHREPVEKATILLGAIEAGSQ